MSERIEPGWYPQVDGTTRYWNGAAWDAEVVAPPVGQPPPPAVQASAPETVAGSNDTDVSPVRPWFKSLPQSGKESVCSAARNPSTWGGTITAVQNATGATAAQVDYYLRVTCP